MPLHDLAGNISTYFDCEDLSDVTIELKGKSIKAHRLILAQGADYFKNLFSVKCEEGSTTTIRLLDDDASAVERMIKHVYGFRIGYVDEDPLKRIPDVKTSPGAITTSVDLFMLGKKYGAHSFARTASVAFYVILKSVQELDAQIELLTKAVWYVYVEHAGPAWDLRERIATHFTMHVSGVGDNDKYKKLLQAVPQFSLDIVEAFSKQRTNMTGSFGSNNTSNGNNKNNNNYKKRKGTQGQRQDYS